VPATVYTATITTGVKDLAGNNLAVNKQWSFTTGAVPDTTAPTVTSLIPNDQSVASINSNVVAVFSEPMDPLTVTNTTFTLKNGSSTVTGTVTYTGKTATFNPAMDLESGVKYSATITTGAKDLAGNPLAVNKSWTFTTYDAGVVAVVVVLRQTQLHPR